MALITNGMNAPYFQLPTDNWNQYGRTLADQGALTEEQEADLDGFFYLVQQTNIAIDEAREGFRNLDKPPSGALLCRPMVNAMHLLEDNPYDKALAAISQALSKL